MPNDFDESDNQERARQGMEAQATLWRQSQKITGWGVRADHEAQLCWSRPCQEVSHA